MSRSHAPTERLDPTSQSVDAASALDELGQSMKGRDSEGSGGAAKKTATNELAGGEGSALPEIPKRAAPGWLKYMPEVVRELWDHGAVFTLDGASGEISLDGFYKNGPMRLVMRDEGVVAVDRRGRETLARHFEDLVDLNFQFWRQANSQKNVYVKPNRPWLDGFLVKRLVKREVIFVPADGKDKDADPE